MKFPLAIDAEVNAQGELILKLQEELLSDGTGFFESLAVNEGRTA